MILFNIYWFFYWLILTTFVRGIYKVWTICSFPRKHTHTQTGAHACTHPYTHLHTYTHPYTHQHVKIINSSRLKFEINKIKELNFKKLGTCCHFINIAVSMQMLILLRPIAHYIVFWLIYCYINYCYFFNLRLNECPSHHWFLN